MKLILLIIASFIATILTIQFFKRRKVRRLTDPRHDRVRNS